MKHFGALAVAAGWWLVSCMVLADPAALIVSPPAGSVLFYGEYLEVELRNVQPQEVDFLLVEAGAFLQQDELQGFPLCVCDGNELSRLSGHGDGGCIVFRWVNKEAGLARVQVPWNYLPAGFWPGLYFVRVKFYIVQQNFITYWAVTDWHLLNLQKSEPMRIEILHPLPETTYIEGAQIEVKARVEHGTLPLTIAAEASTQGKEWFVVKTTTSKTAEFEFSLDTKELMGHFNGLPGEYSLQIRVTDSRGKTALSKPVKFFIKQGPIVHILLDRPGPFFVGDDVKFDFVTDPPTRWVAVKWSFGDGTESTEWAPTHRYTKAGCYEVQLEASDATGLTAKASVIIEIKEIKERITAIRKIWGYPVCGVSEVATGLLRGKKFTVEIKLSLLEEMVGLIVEEVLPQGLRWEGGNVKTTNPGIGWMPLEDGGKTSWLILGSDGLIPRGTELTIEYTVSVDERTILGEVIFAGKVLAVFGPGQEAEVSIIGDKKARIVDRLPLYVALYFLTVEEGEIKLRQPSANESFLLTADHMEIAKMFLETPQNVPVEIAKIFEVVQKTGGQVLTGEDYLRLQTLYVHRVPVTAWLELFGCR